MTMYKIAVIGERESVLGFRALGLDVRFVADGEQARQTLHRLAQEDYAVIYLTETFSAACDAEIAKYKDVAVPAIILIPGRGGSLGVAEAALQSAVERAVGADIS